MKTIHLKVDGMSCGHCVAAVKKALEAIEGVHSAEVNLDPGEAIVQGEVEEQVLMEALADEGYEARSL